VRQRRSRSSGVGTRAIAAPVAASFGAAGSKTWGVERELLLERLANLRTIVPVFAKELASARRQSEELRTENDRLLARIEDLQRQSARGR